MRKPWIAPVGAMLLAAALSLTLGTDAFARGRRASGPPPGMNESGEVIDSSAVEQGYGEKVTGLNSIDGEVTGKPAPGSKFSRLQIGMPMKQVTDLIGEPTDEGAYVTGKAFIPFYFGGDKHRYEYAYKGQGRLVFASKGMSTGGNLIWIIHNANDSGYRD